MPNKQRSIINDFSRGMVDRVPADQIPDNAVADALNMEFTKRRHLGSRPGCSILNYHDNRIGTLLSDFSGYVSSGADALSWDSTGAYDPLGTFTGAAWAVNPLTPGHVASLDNTFVLASKVSTNERVTVSQMVGLFAPFQVPGTSKIISPLWRWTITLDDGVDSTTFDVLFRWSDNGEELTVTSENAPSDLRVGHFKHTNVSTAGGVFWFEVWASVNSGDVGGAGFELTFQWTLEDEVTLSTTEPVEPIPLTLWANVIYLWGHQLYAGDFRAVAPSRLRSTDAATASTLGRVTSLYDFEDDTGRELIVTSGTDIYRYDTTDKNFDAITGGISLPDNTLWQWVSYDGMAIGVNRGTGSQINPVMIDGVGSAPAQLNANAPKGRYIAVFNDRIWIVDEAEPWKVKCSKVGDPQDWTDTDPYIGTGTFDIGGADEKRAVTGLHVYQGVLLAFKRDAIYAIVPGSPVTDLSQYDVIALTTDGLGALSGHGIATILGDVVFLSRNGLTTLRGLTSGGNYEATYQTTNLEDFQDMDRDTDFAVLKAYPAKSQLLIAFRSLNQTSNDRTYIMDYSDVGNGDLAFTRANGACLAECMAIALIDGVERLLIGSAAGTDAVGHVWTYDDADTVGYSDQGRDYAQTLVTKAFDFGDSFLKKEVHEWGLNLQLLTNPAGLDVSWTNDLQPAAKRIYQQDLEGVVAETGGRLGSFILGTDTLSSGSATNIVWEHEAFAVTNTFSTVARTFQARIDVDKATGVVLRGLLLTYTPVEDKNWTSE